MKKHFLLLLLLTLLPLAGWAYSIEVDVEVKPYNASVVWSGIKPSGVETNWIGAPGSSLTTDVKNAIAEQLEINNLADYNAGIHDYYLQLKSTADGYVETVDTRYNIRLNDANTAKLTITKFTGDPLISASGLAYVVDGLKYTGSAQSLLQGGATATANGFSVPVIYTLDPAAETVVKFDNYADVKATDAGDYTVYYKVAETDNYKGSDWTELASSKSIAKATTAAFNVVAVPGLVFNNDDQALVTKDDAEAPIVPFGADGLQYQIDGGDWTALPANGLAGITRKSAKNAVAYSVKFKIPESANWENIESGAIDVTIAKATPVFTYVPTHENGGLPTGLVYDTHSHQLVLQQATAIVPNTEISVPLKYSIRRYRNVTGNYTSVTVKPFNELVGTVASNKYVIKAYNEATEDLNQVIETFEDIEIAKATIPADAYTEPVAKNVRTTGAAQDLVDAATWTGETTYGTFQYSLTNNGTDWSTDVPQGTGVAEYTVYWRILPTVVSDTRNYNIVSGSVAAKIENKSTVTIAAKANQTFGYGTTPVIDYTTVWTEQGSDELNVTGMEWKWYTNSDCSTPATEDGHGNFTVGDYYVKATGAIVTGTTAASQEIVYTPVAVKITAGQVTAKISGEATYGSLPTFTLTHVSGLSPAEAENFNAGTNLTKVTIKQNGEVVNNLEIVDPNDARLAALAKGEYDLEATASCGTNYAVVVTGEKLTVGAKSIATAAIDVTTDANAIVYNNKAWGTVNPIEFTVTETSGIEAADYDVTYSNNVNAGTATITLTGKRNYTGTTTQNFTIKKAALTIKAGDTTWTYGTTEPTYAVTVEGQAEGETALAVGGTLAGIDDALTVVRTSNETVGMHAGALLVKFGTAQPAESDNYTITYYAGDLQVAKGAVVIQLKEAVTATYGDNPATSIDAAIKNIANYEYVSGLSELEAANFASIIDVAAATFELTETKPQVGTDYTFAITGATSTNYGVTINPGTYNVTAAPITLYAKDQAINWATDPTDTPNTTVSDETVAIAKGELKYAGTDIADALTDVVASIVIASQNVGNNNISLTAAENPNYNIIVNKDADNNDKFGNLAVTGAAGITITRLDATENPTPGTTVADKLSEYNGVTANITLNATSSIEAFNTIKADRWYSLVLPFNTSVREVSERFGYAVVDIMDESSSKTTDIDFRLYLGDLEANKPFIFKVDKDIDLTSTPVTFTDKEIVYSAEPVASTADGKVKFIGVYDGKTGFSGHEYFFSLGSGNISGTKATSYVVPMGAYIHMEEQMDGMANSPEFHIEEPNGMTTSIKAIDFAKEGSAASSEGWYNLNGVQLESAPNQKGVYIQNGKKIVIK